MAPPPAFWRGVVFRFAFVYWTLFCIPVISTQIAGLDWIGRAIGSVWNPMVVWVDKNILAIPYDFSTAEGDPVKRIAGRNVPGHVRVGPSRIAVALKAQLERRHWPIGRYREREGALTWAS